jgi:glycosyltransferase involved in cell wall biosynthesis
VTQLRVGVNLLWLVVDEVGGSEDYGIGLLHAIARRPEAGSPVVLTLYLSPDAAEAHAELAQVFPTRVAPVGARRRASRVAAEHTWLPVATRRDRIDLVHHLGGTMPLIGATPGIVHVHDLQPWAMPQNFSRTKRAYLRATVPRGVRRARGVTTLSRWVADDVQARLGAAADRVVVLPPGPERLIGRHDPLAARPVLDRLGIGDRPFFLYPVITYPHKNHRTLIEAFSRVAAVQPEPLLVLTGGAGPAEAEVRRAITEAGMAGRVLRLGRVPHDELDVLYRRTRALTFASRYEGFGMSLLEVMAHGRPVVASSAAALPEVVGSGGVLLGPDDVAGWAEEMSRLLDDEDHWVERARAARARAATFSWDRTVDELLAFYERVGAGARSARA